MLKRWTILAIFGALAAVGTVTSQSVPANTVENRITEHSTRNAGSQQAKPQSNYHNRPESASINEPTPSGGDQNITNTEQENLDVQRKLEWFTGGLVIVGLLQAITMLWQACLLRGTLRSIQAQANQMKRQTGILETSVEIARTSTEVFIAKEKAHIRAQIRPLIFELIQNGEPGEMTALVGLTVSNYGMTDAFTDLAEADVLILDSDHCASDIRGDDFPLPPVISRGDKITTFDFRTGVITRDVRDRRLFVHFYGRIRYRDVFENSRETSFYYIWREVGNSTRSKWEKQECDGYNNEY